MGLRYHVDDAQPCKTVGAVRDAYLLQLTMNQG